MRRLLAPVALLLALSACGAQASPTLTPLPLAGLDPTSGLDVAAGRDAIVRFLHGYADAGRVEGRQRLSEAVAGGPLTDWASWLTVQNDANPGTLTGAVDVRRARFLEFFQDTDTRYARFDIDATVKLTYRPPAGASATRVHDFTGEAIVVERSPGRWGVYDITRDGRSLLNSIYTFPADAKHASSGLAVRLDSVFTFPPFWSFNFLVDNGSAGAVRLLGGATLFGVDADGKQGLGPGIGSQSVTPNLRRIPPGGSAAGTANFEPEVGQPPQGVVLLRFATEDGLANFPFRFSLQRAPAPPTGQVPIPTQSG